MMDNKESKLIRKLPEAVINQIKAGEVIARPVNAVKELMENSLDAGSTNICISVKDGGKESIRIRDNGCGISKDDLICAIERHTTSKLTAFEDLSKLQTLGFRGEALSSMAEISLLTLTSKTRNEAYGHKIVVREGRVMEGPTKIASNVGTSVNLDQIFSNMPIRKQSLKSPAEEYSAIMDVVSKYAIHHSTRASFVVEKQESRTCDLQTDLNNSIVDNIRVIYGSEVAQNLIPISVKCPKDLFQMSGLISKVNYNFKKFVFILFINDRLVDCSLVKKSALLVYKIFMPKTCLPFIYMNIKMNPENIDVNIHPQKYEVRFRYDEYIVTEIKTEMETLLTTTDISSPMSTKNSCQISSTLNRESSFSFTQTPTTSKAMSKVLPSKKIRNDHLSQTLDEVWARNEYAGMICVGQLDPVKVEVSYIDKLRLEVKENNCAELRELLKNSSCISPVGEDMLAVQHRTHFVVLNSTRLSEELFYQIYLDNIANFAVIRFKEPLNIRTLLEAFIKHSNYPFEQSSEEMTQFLVKESYRESMNTYFAIDITADGMLKSLPLLIQGYPPDMMKLPIFLDSLVTFVQWNDPELFFRTFGLALAKFYSPEDRSNSSDNHKLLVNVLYPKMKQILRPPVSLRDAFNVCVSTQKLYRVFERC
ncbi:DNA mismatch repair ATPase Mlh1 [Brevipalpus obovatus]|uniref:DNA mismatch repair ATPase Mlh1 n=1 Tax=Brevipalpus obovatus TaxID=246614 RepID=UPI003D9E7298